MSTFNRPVAWGLLLLAFALPFVAGCDSDALSDANPRSSSVDPLFDRYVSIGNSITAGFQSNGINNSTQMESYAVLLAGQMNTTFEIPAIRNPGCPPPVTNILTGQLVGTVPGGCAFRGPTTALSLNNVAVPGARTIDVLTNAEGAGARPSALTRLVLGGRTQVEAALQANPTFASVWIGNNDVLGAALAGDPGRITPQSDFETQYTQIVDSLEAGGVDGGVLTSVADVSVIPALSQGVTYLGATGGLPGTTDVINPLGQNIASSDDDDNTVWGNFSVSGSCAPSADGQALVSISYGLQGLFQLALYGEDVVLDCADDRPLIQRYPVIDSLNAADNDFNVSVGTQSTSLLTSSEQDDIADAVSGYNDFISGLAGSIGSDGWAYVDPNPALRSLYADGTDTPTNPFDDAVPKFPNPNPDRAAGESTFGIWFSEDGVHPSAATHQVVTNLFVEAINEEYGTSLEPIDAPPLP